MATAPRRIVLILLSVLAVLVVVGFAWPFASIELRLWRNGRIAQELADALEARYPGIGFRGAASYKDEVVTIVVVSRIDQAKQDDVETWLRKQKSEQNIAPRIRLRVVDGDSVKDVMVD